MILYPAIDIQEGRVVRLRRGDFARSTVFDDDPVAMARHWESLGATALHVVDLDAARTGAPVNFAIVQRIVAELSIPVQYGGGVRSAASLSRVAAGDVRWVVMGTAAVTQTDLLEAAVDELGDRLVVGVDCSDGMVATHGWHERTAMPASRFVAQLERLGVRRIVFTDIATDGMMQGPNVPALLDLAGRTALEIVQSGGITALDDVRRLAAEAPPNVVGVIVGRALYEGAFTLPEALDVLGCGGTGPEGPSAAGRR
jgi:phosphoribosylformimino-5-aminoimidazole carboxamide ribotide isomerase